MYNKYITQNEELKIIRTEIWKIITKIAYYREGLSEEDIIALYGYLVRKSVEHPNDHENIIEIIDFITTVLNYEKINQIKTWCIYSTHEFTIKIPLRIIKYILQQMVIQKQKY